MKFRFLSVAVASLAIAAPVAAQNPYPDHCPPGNTGALVPNQDRATHASCVARS